MKGEPVADECPTDLETEALRYHARGRPGKVSLAASKPMVSQRDLVLAYSPGVAAPVRRIAESPEAAYQYTARGNYVAVITNGTAILGLGNLGPLAAKPVMEGKAVLFKRFADIDAVDLEIDTEDPAAFIQAVRHLGPSFAGINLEDIASPQCFEIEEGLQKVMDIPVFHDDQHGTAIICLAALLNAIEIAGKRIEDVRIVLNGAGAAGVACLNLVKRCGARHENCLALDSKGVLDPRRDAPMNARQAQHALESDATTLAEALRGADVFLGLSRPDLLTPAMLESMAERPIVFAMANPDPEIAPALAKQVRTDVIIATGRSDFPNQVNNVLGFPYIFRGALDVRARAINDEMKIAAARAIADLAREEVPDEVTAAYGQRPVFGPDYIIPAPFDPRLLHRVPPAVAKAAMETGAAGCPIEDFEVYENRLRARLDPTASILRTIQDKAAAAQKRMLFAEGEDERVVRAAIGWVREGLGTAVLVGGQEVTGGLLQEFGGAGLPGIAVVDPSTSDLCDIFAERLYGRLQRRGRLRSDCGHEVRGNPHVFGACMVAGGEVDAMVTGATRKAAYVLSKIGDVIGSEESARAVGVSLVIARERPVLIADTLGNEWPEAPQLADIAVTAAGTARRFGIEPRVAFLSFSTFGYPQSPRAEALREAVRILERRDVDFAFDGEMAADVALLPEAMADYPFCRLGGPANVLVMPASHSASISTKLLQHLAGSTVIGPLTAGWSCPIQICATSDGVSNILNMAMVAACRYC